MKNYKRIFRGAVMCAAGLMALGAGLAASAQQAKELTIERLGASPSLSGPSVQGLKLSPDGARVTFLRGKADNQAQLDLWEFDVRTGESRLLVDSRTLLGAGPEILSEEEKARRERNRSLTGKSGIVSYFWSQDGEALLFPLGGDIYLLPLGGEPVQLTVTDAFETDIRFSPKGNYVSFIRERDLYVINVKTRKETRLTKDANETVANGMAEFIAQEELGRFTGYWWSPDESRIAFEQFNESAVAVKDRFEIQADGSVITHKQRYPAAGEANVSWKLGIAEVKNARLHWVDIPGGAERDDYLGRVHWIKGGKELVFEQLNREQTRLDYVVRDIKGQPNRNPQGYSYENSTWVNLYDDFYNLSDGRILLTRDWEQAEGGAFKHILMVDPETWQPTPLTSGNWVVHGIESVDEDAGLVYFTAAKDSPIEKHLYKVALAGGEPERVSLEAGWHSVRVGTSFYIDQFSSPEVPPTIVMRDLKTGETLSHLLENRLDETHPYEVYLDGHVQSQFGTLKAADGVTDLYYRLYLPADYDEGTKYPTIMAPYGGPHGQRVQYAWSVDFNQILARQGYVVMVLDNRGMWNRGNAFEAHLKHKMGRPEIADQVTGVNWLVEKGIADPERVGIWGWSYGGYMTLMALGTAGDTFKAGVSVAPVTDWLLYDTGYTERYLGNPNSPDGSRIYRESSVFPYMDQMTGDLLLIHGMADDNVFFDNSVKLMSDLQNKGKAFELMTYPGKKHGIRGAETRAHLWKTVFDFFERKLK